jgi:hypothetical protein
LLKINLDFLLRKTGASLNFKIKLGSLHISPEDKGVKTWIKKSFYMTMPILSSRAEVRA